MSNSFNSRLTIAQKIDALKLIDSGMSEREVANIYSTGNGTINRIKHSRNNLDELKNDDGNNLTHLKKRKNCVFKPQYGMIVVIGVKFLEAARERGMPVTGPMFRSLAERHARKNSIEGFSASEGWLGKVKSRHGISGRKLSGESGAVDKVVIKNWKEEIPGIINGYEMRDIVNCDETALFFKQPTNNSLVTHSDHNHGYKRDISRITLLLCTSWAGEKEKILMIGASENLRALKQLTNPDY